MTLRAQFVKDAKSRMQTLGISQRELARRLGTSQSYVTRLLSGKVAPTTDTIERIAKELGCAATLRLIAK